MRSASGPLVVIIGLAMTVALVLLLFVNLGTRSELEAARGELESLRVRVDAMEPGVTTAELEEQLSDIEGGIRNLLIATRVDGGADGGADGGGSESSPGMDDATGTAIVERLDEILDRIEALDDRVDEICGNVPVC
jgi:hypothetical protein